MPLSIVILAAGQGKRMKSDLPKVLQPLAGRPMLSHVIDCARSLDARAIHVVYGHGGEQVRAMLAEEAVNAVLQAKQLGTGHDQLDALRIGLSLEVGQQALHLDPALDRQLAHHRADTDFHG